MEIVPLINRSAEAIAEALIGSTSQFRMRDGNPRHDAALEIAGQHRMLSRLAVDHRVDNHDVVTWFMDSRLQLVQSALGLQLESRGCRPRR